MRHSRNDLKASRKRRIRARISGTPERPRLSVHVSLKRIAVQAIDDTKGVTLFSASSLKGKNIAAAIKLGEDIAKKAQEQKVTTIVFDRNGLKYHGRIKALADAARKSGLVF